ncbi:MAG: hypothetical protein LCH88_09125 [Proteobacteria bacterium]|nr:hypothetical protein [Pseudomonadota bacterium]
MTTFRREDAEFLRDNPLLKATLAKLEKDHFERALSAAPSDPDAVSDALHMVRAIRALDGELRRMSAAPPPKRQPVA